MANNHVILGNETILDLRNDTVTPTTLMSGYTAHNAAGETITGTFDPSIYVLKSGDTMTGSLHIQDRVLFVDSTCGNSIYLQAYSTGNQGIYSSGYYTDSSDPSTYTSSPAWIIRRNSAGDVYVPLWASTGSSNTPVYIDSVGKPVACGDVNRSTYTHWLEASQGRLADINFSHMYANDKVHMRLDIASSTLVSNPFSNDGYVLTFMWDNSGAYDTQIYIPDGASGVPKMRKRLNSTWGNPVTFLTVPSGSGVGTSSKPIYISTSGAPTECSYDFTDYILKSGGTMTGALNFGTTGKISETELKINGRNLFEEFKTLTANWATAIPANADLNTTTYLKRGTYYVALSTTAETLTNCPTQSAFRMEVEYPTATVASVPSTYAYVSRTITTYNGGMYYQYVSASSTPNEYTYGDWILLRFTGSAGNVIKQIRTNDANDYQILFSENTGRDSVDKVSRTRKNECLYYKPSSGELHLERASSITSNIYSYFIAGNAKVAGTDQGCNAGVLRLYGQKSFYAQFADTGNSLTANRTYTLPNKDGELALKESSVQKTGDTMTGSLSLTDRGVSINSTTAARSFAIGSTSGISVAYQISAAGSQGLWSSGYASSLTDTSTYTASSKWIIYRNSSGNVYAPEWASIGSATSPVYIDSSGRPAACTSSPSSLVSGNFVTSVAVTGSKGVSISGSPITSSGTIDVSISTSSGTATRNTTNTSAGEIKYVKYGRVVTIYTTSQITVTSSGAAADKTYFSGLPKPSVTVIFSGTGPSNKSVPLKITTDGYLQGVFIAPPSGALYAGFTYIAAS